jgi:hypothetical protein
MVEILVFNRGLIDSNAARCIALRVPVDQQNLLFRRGEGRREVDGCRGLPDTTLLIGNTNNFSNCLSQKQEV